MSWTRGEKGKGGQIGTVHVYKTLAKLSDHEYRTLLYQVTGCRSSADLRLTQDDYDRFMAALELTLWERYGQGLCDAPPAWVRPRYWQDRCPANGRVNSRQLRLIRGLAERLLAELAKRPPGGGDYHAPATVDAWLWGVARQAGCPVDRIEELGEKEADRIIEACKDRLRGMGIDPKEAGLTQGRTRRRTARAGLTR